MQITLIKKWRRWLCFMLLGIITAGCAGVPPFPPHQRAAVAAADIHTAMERCWLNGQRRYLCRNSGVLDVPGRKIALQGLVRVDSVADSARLVALDSMGTRLFDISIDARDYTVNYMLEQLRAHPRLAAVVAASVRAVFLSPYVAGTPQLVADGSRWLVDGAAARFEFGGRPLRLQRRLLRGDNECQVDYYAYGGDFPGGIVLDATGYSLTLWIEEVKQLP